jgi:hypothetical protein
MGKLSRRAEALNLIARIRDACRRPLFVEIALLERRQTGERKHISSELSQTSDSALHKDVVQRKRGRSGDEKTQDWTWEEVSPLMCFAELFWHHTHPLPLLNYSFFFEHPNRHLFLLRRNILKS